MKVRTVGTIILVEPPGDLTTDNGARELRAKVEDLIELGQNKILLNLRNVVYADIGGIEAFLAVHDAAVKSGGRLLFCHLTPGIGYLLNMTKLSNAMAIYSDERQALARFR